MSTPMPFKNYGNTCFLNAAMQAITSTNEIVHKYRKCPEDLFVRVSDKDTSLVTKVLRILIQKDSASAIYLIYAMMCNSNRIAVKKYQQSDAHEALVYLLESIIAGSVFKERIKVNFKNIDLESEHPAYKDCALRAVQNIEKEGASAFESLVGWTTTHVRCSCGYSNFTHAKFTTLTVSLERTTNIVSAVREAYGNTEKLGDYKCDACGESGTCTKQEKISIMPRVIYIHIRRISGSERVQTPVSFPFMLNLADLEKAMWSKRERTFQLKSIIYHSGSTHSGHYYADVFRDGARYLCDDTFIRKKNGEFTLQDLKNVYVLAYERFCGSVPS